VAITNALQLAAAIATPAPSCFNYDAVLSLKVTEPIHCYIIALLLLIHYFTLWPWPLAFDLEHFSVLPTMCWNSVPNLNAIEQSTAELLRFQCLTLWPWTLLRLALDSGIIFTKFDLRQLVRAW